MSTKKSIVLFSLILGVLLPLSLAADQTHDLQGKDTVAQGARKILTGVLTHSDNEWYLKADDAAYLLHLGRMRTEAEAVFKVGMKAAVDGFVNRNQIAPVTVEAAGKKLAFWDEAGRPVWAGRGNGDGRRDGAGRRGGQGRGRNN
jgi:hypothetical protein